MENDPSNVVGKAEEVRLLKTEMRNTEGGYFSAMDADTNGEEGVFYVWKKEELKKLRITSLSKEGLTSIGLPQKDLEKPGRLCPMTATKTNTRIEG